MYGGDTDDEATGEPTLEGPLDTSSEALSCRIATRLSVGSSLKTCSMVRTELPNDGMLGCRVTCGVGQSSDVIWRSPLNDLECFSVWIGGVARKLCERGEGEAITPSSEGDCGGR